MHSIASTKLEIRDIKRIIVDGLMELCTREIHWVDWTLDIEQKCQKYVSSGMRIFSDEEEDVRSEVVDDCCTLHIINDDIILFDWAQRK